MKKKNILVVFTGSMELGGIERSFLGLLDSIDYEKYNVYLFLLRHSGEIKKFEKSINFSRVRLLFNADRS